MADVLDEFYTFRQVGTAQSRALFTRSFQDRRPLIQDLPVPVEELYRLIAFVLQIQTENPLVDVYDFTEGGKYFPQFLAEIKKCNEAGYAKVVADAREPDIQHGYIVLSILRGFQKSKPEIDSALRAQAQNRKTAEQAGPAQPNEGMAAAATLNIPNQPRTPITTAKLAVRRRTPPQRGAFPQLVPDLGPIRNRSPTPRRASPLAAPFSFSSPARSKSRSRSPTPPPPFGGGEVANDGYTTLSSGQESSLTRLLASLGEYDSMSDLWTVNVASLRHLFPQALRMREPDVVVAEMEFAMDVDSSPSVEPDVTIEDSP